MTLLLAFYSIAMTLDNLKPLDLNSINNDSSNFYHCCLFCVIVFKIPSILWQCEKISFKKFFALLFRVSFCCIWSKKVTNISCVLDLECIETYHIFITKKFLLPLGCIAIEIFSLKFMQVHWWLRKILLQCDLFLHLLGSYPIS